MKSSRSPTTFVHLINHSDINKGGAQKIVHLICAGSAQINKILAFDSIMNSDGIVQSSSIFKCFAILLRSILFEGNTFYVVHHRIFLPIFIFLRRKNFVFVCHGVFPRKNFVYRMMGKSPCVAVSPEVESYLRKFNSNLVVKVISNGVAAPIGEERCVVSDGKFKIGYVGRITKEKGVFDLVEAYLLFQQHYAGSAQLDVVGFGPDLEDLKKKILQQTGMQTINFFGHNNEPFKLLRHSDLIVIPSHHEGFGLVFHEAYIRNHNILASKLPVFLRQPLDENISFFNVGDVSDLARMLSRESERLQNLASTNQAPRGTSHLTSVDEMVEEYSTHLGFLASAKVS